MGKPEGKIEMALVKRIRAIGGEIRKAMWISRRGCPDRRAMLPQAHRQHLQNVLARAGRQPLWTQNPWVECKAPGEPLEDHQEREHNRMRALGELILVIDSLEDIDRYFPLELP